MKAEEDVFEIQKFLLSEESVDTIFDVGAWIGKTAANYSNAFPNAHMHVFEPFPESFEKLTRNTEENNSQNFSLNQVAVCAEEGQKSLHSNKIETTNSLLPSISTDSEHDFYRDTVDVIQVEATSLDAYCHKHNIDKINILKIDTQGGELEVFKGAERLLRDSSIDLIYCEVSFVAMYKDSPLFHNIAAHLEQYDYKFHSLYGEVKNEYGQLAWSDAIFYSSRIANKVKSVKVQTQ